MAVDRSFGARGRVALCLAALLVSSLGTHAAAQEPAACLNPDPSARPAPAAPYFLVIADSSSSQHTDVGTASACGFGRTRLAHERCALRNTFTAYAGRANFGLATYAMTQTGCAAACTCNTTDTTCFGACGYGCAPSEVSTRGTCSGCGPRPGLASTAAGLWIRVPVLQDHFWSAPPDPSNVSQLLSWVDASCGSDAEIFGSGNTPLNGSLRDAGRYFRTGWTAPDGSVTYATPLDASDRACRPVNVILITDSDENCDTQADAVAAAADLFTNGAVIGGRQYPIRVHVIDFAGATVASTDAIAAAGGTTSSRFVTNEAQMEAALATIVESAIRAETCNNADDDCNGCTDDGFAHYCDRAQTCCTWVTPAQRTTCLNGYRASITTSNPLGNRALLPCTTLAQQTQPSTWLCYAPGEACDGVDNDCNGIVDDGTLRCGSPAHCAVAETCNGVDDDCNGTVDDGAVCMGCIPQVETCNGCDDDCDGVADDGLTTPVTCGTPSPPNCLGTRTCSAPVAVSTPGACVTGRGYGACSNVPQTESCDGADNDCDGTIDDGVPPAPCTPPGTPGGLMYGGISACRLGTQRCGSTTCEGFIGPSAEVCNGIDDDCDGRFDESPVGVGVACGRNSPPCTPGVTACMSGALVCTGTTGGRPEICNGVDDDCDGAIDDGPLADGPPPGANGCWDLPGNCCSFGALRWCPPPGATCSDVAGLGAPCGAGTLSCASGAWTCTGVRAPSVETCDGIDDDCNGTVDDGVLPGVGDACGSSVGTCTVGALTCASGALRCTGTTPSTEICDGLDDDCDGNVDEAMTSASCVVAYDALAFPGDRTAGVCRAGATGCVGGADACVGGVGPSAERCNGLDDDCDGTVDETGAAPDGIDGSASPADATAIVGAACGSGGATCGAAWTCTDARVVCTARSSTAETCNCLDDDCDGSIDEGGASLCGAAGSCAAVGPGSCVCAAACTTTDECPVGAACEAATESGTGASLGLACLPDACGDCSTRFIASGSTVVCAPAGTTTAGCVTPPVCVCTADGCGSPCAGVTCPSGQACAERGPSAGTCITPHCPEVSCNACGTLCAPDGRCVDDPCDPSPCPSGSACTPSADLATFTCSGVPDAGARDAGLSVDAGGFDAGGAPAANAGGCGCAVPARSRDASMAWLALLALGLVVRARRRTRALGIAIAIATLVLAPGCSTPSGGDDSGSDVDGARDVGTTDAPSTDARADAPSPDACAPSTEVCNGRDDDCNGVADDVTATDVHTCGGCGHDCTVLAVGCARDAVTCDGTTCGCSRCAPGLRDLDGNGSCESTCSPSSVPDDQCDGIDDDCDGTRDEDANLCVAPNCGGCGHTCETLHGVGECTVTGPSCGAGDARCTIVACECTDTSNCWHDLDGLASTGCEYACSFTNGGLEICDGLDNDCDGRIDGADDLTGDARVGVSCQGGTLGACASPAHAGATACIAGGVVCSGPDVLAPGSAAETCNGIDDDCNGAVDDAPTDAGGSCGTSSTAPCALGRLVCRGGALACVGAIEPSTETCNGRDDDCNGAIDDAIAAVGTACNVPPPAPPGATSACSAGTLVCASGSLVCAGAVGPAAPSDACGVDSNCDGALTGQPDFDGDPRACGSCGNDCLAGAVHAQWACVARTCTFRGCQPGFYDLDHDDRCEYACTFISPTESCNGVDDNCNGLIDEGVVAPSPSAVCGVSPLATTPECTTGVGVACVTGAWRCTFPAGVCGPSCAAATEICDALDNDCDGFVNENVPNFGMACASDDGLPTGDGACRTTGTYVCNGASTTRCSAVRNLAAVGPELCDGIDNDCDGLTDEPFINKGPNATYFVRPAVTRIASTTWIFSYEASRPTATPTSPGSGNGYFTSAPVGATFDRTYACSAPTRMPWTNVTPQEVAQTCAALGGTICPASVQTSACQATTPCTWGYNPRGTSCVTPLTSTRYCNLGPYDFSTTLAGDQDGMLSTASPFLQNCWADWSGLLANTSANNRIYDITGNVREIVSTGPTTYTTLGGSFLTTLEAGATCSTATATVDQTYSATDAGFRCCFSADPTL